MITKKIYIAGALNADAVGYIQNMHRMIIWGRRVQKLGCGTFVPGLDFLAGLVHGDFEYPDYFDNSQPWLEVSDAMFVTPKWENSKGTHKEIERAERLGIPVFYTIESLKEWLKGENNGDNN